MNLSHSNLTFWPRLTLRASRIAAAAVGGIVTRRLANFRHLAAVLGTTLFIAAQPRQWRRTVRKVFAQQLLHFGIKSVPFILVLAILVGISIVVQLDVWTGKLGQSQKLGPLLVAVVARELAPLFANFVLIVRGGSAIATELGLMKAGGEVRVLEAQGIDPLPFLVMPRVVAMALSAFCLTVIFVVVAFASGFSFGSLFGQANADPTVFINSVFKAVHPFDAIGLLVKCLVPALLTSVICSIEGLSAEAGVTNVPGVVKKALARSLAALFLTSVIVSFLTYS
jgi:phospholipid/cholesterol/gamma-HCH transport system permease protein